MSELRGTYWCVVWTQQKTGERWPLPSTFATRRTDSIAKFCRGRDRKKYDRDRRAGIVKCEKIVLHTKSTTESEGDHE